jgi:hypothetical protein
LLLYVTGGLAGARFRTTSDDLNGGATPLDSHTFSEWHLGWVVGFGIEWAWSNNLTFKSEMLYANFADRKLCDRVVVLRRRSKRERRRRRQRRRVICLDEGAVDGADQRGVAVLLPDAGVGDGDRLCRLGRRADGGATLRSRPRRSIAQ